LTKSYPTVTLADTLAAARSYIALGDGINPRPEGLQERREGALVLLNRCRIQLLCSGSGVRY